MCGLLSPTSGDVLADNLDITKIGLNNYRHGTACVLQEDRLFSGSLIDNISGFEDNADINFVMECARRCNIHDEIMKMPMGYETIVGELGLGISGGQKQRILIARALYRKPSILFMDEATSHLDLKNESVINQSISALSITRIIVAHRPSTIASAESRYRICRRQRISRQHKKERTMQGTFIGFNTAGITFENRFMALLLKIKQENGLCQQYYLQAPIVLESSSYPAKPSACNI